MQHLALPDCLSSLPTISGAHPERCASEQSLHLLMPTVSSFLFFLQQVPPAFHDIERSVIVGRLTAGRSLSSARLHASRVVLML